jgi:hypothetical protein
MTYAIGTGYYSADDGYRKGDKRELFAKWFQNTTKFSTPETIYVIDANSTYVPTGYQVEWIRTKKNFGHLFDNKNEFFTGWAVSFMLSALRCYADGHDFIYKEQDCFAWGDWVTSLYSDLETKKAKMLVGRGPWEDLKVEQSLVIIKNDFIPTFISEYMLIKESDKVIPNENKFAKVMEKYPEIQFMSMNGGRVRPITPHPTYAQQLNEQELKDLC